MDRPTSTLTHERVQELLAHILAADDALVSPRWVSDAEVVQRVWLCVHALGTGAAGLGLDRLERLSNDISITMSALLHTGAPICEEALDHIERGLMVLGVMVRDLERQLDGHAPAALDDAIDALIDMRRDYLRRDRTA